MEEMPVFSIIIPVYNAEKTIRRCLDSIKQQSFAEYEVIIVNDGSSDSSEELIRPYLLDKRYHYFWQKNQGSNKAYNRAISIAKGDYIISLDDDDAISSEALFFTAELISLQYPDIIQFRQCIGCEAIKQYEQEKPARKREQDSSQTNNFGFGNVNLHTHSGKAIKRALFSRVPHPPFTGDPVGADSRLTIRLLWISRRIVFLPSAAWFHYESPLSQSRKPISTTQYLMRLHSWIEEETNALSFYEGNKGPFNAIPDLWDLYVLYLHLQVKYHLVQKKETIRFAKLIRRHKGIVMERVTLIRRLFLILPFVSTKCSLCKTHRIGQPWQRTEI